MNKRVMLVMMLVIFSLVFVSYGNAATLTNECKNNATLSSNSASSWPMFQKNPKSTGYSESDAPDTAEILWTNDEYYQIDDNSPIIDNGKLYVCGWGGQVYCLDALTGEDIWEYDLGSGITINGIPAVYDNKLYVGTDKDLDEKNIGVLFCLDAESGYEMWQFETGWPIEGAIVAKDDAIYFTTNDVYCVDAHSGYEIWSVGFEGIFLSSPTVSNDMVFVGGIDTNLLYCLDAENGDLLWNFMTDSGVNTPSVYDESIYFSTRTGTIYCLDLYYGYENWIEETYSPMDTSPAIAYEKLYIGSHSRESGYFFCLDAYSGYEVWSYQTVSSSNGYEPIEGSAAVADGKVYFGGAGSDYSRNPQGFIYCLDAETGEELWTYQTDAYGGSVTGIYSSPAIANGIVYFTVNSGEKHIYAFGGEIDYPTRPSIEGATHGENGAEYYYYFLSVDEPGEELYYYIEWGDGTTTGWIGPYIVDEPCEVSHIWDNEDTYTIKAKAKNSYGEESDWATLEVSMPKNKPQLNILETLFSNILRLFQNRISIR